MPLKAAVLLRGREEGAQGELRALVLRHPWLAVLPAARVEQLDAAYATVDVLDLAADKSRHRADLCPRPRPR
ncbi:hypothetical protein ABT279_45445 [Amycolatopsis sp. NPDC000673]|uniref:hypothetical protein n=1 Tax=unclassified Amycolatopsis TaxID=2618356 RepID=UPI0033304CB6